MFLGIIPARKGKKRKNLWKVGGLALIEWVVLAGLTAKLPLICSTDDEDIADICRQYGVPIHHREESLCGDDVPVWDVIKSVKLNYCGYVLLQPTSPFVRKKDIDAVVEALRLPRYRSAQTVTMLSHNFHAYNQRIIDDDGVRFAFKEREVAFNKQRKPTHYRFGNVVAARRGFPPFSAPSYPIIIPEQYAMDVDEKGDIRTAERYLEEGLV